MATQNDTATKLQTLSASIDGAAAIVASVADDVADNPSACRQLYAVQALLESLSRDVVGAVPA